MQPDVGVRGAFERIALLASHVILSSVTGLALPLALGLASFDIWRVSLVADAVFVGGTVSADWLLLRFARSKNPGYWRLARVSLVVHLLVYCLSATAVLVKLVPDDVLPLGVLISLGYGAPGLAFNALCVPVAVRLLLRRE